MAGLTAAYVLQRNHDVTLFESESRAGGHAHTHDVPMVGGGSLPVDTGFMVFNRQNYPSLVRLFRELDVRSQGSDMSMSLVCDECSLSYVAGSPLRAAPHPRSTDRLDRWHHLMAERATFEALAVRFLDGQHDPDLTVGRLLDANGYSDFFGEHFVLPMVSALWSCGETTARDYPARYLFEFLNNHGLMAGSEPIRWRTVTGGSREYVGRIIERLSLTRLGLPIRSLWRVSDGVELRDATDSVHTFHRAVIAVHPHQALRMLADARPNEKSWLGKIRYADNETVLHTDSSFLPDDPRGRASWNLRRTSGSATGKQTCSYYLNRLQQINSASDYIVTLNPDRSVREDAVIARMTYAHPVYTPQSVAARTQLPGLNSPRLAFAGAYQGWGFHEDGCVSGVRAAAALGSRWP